MLSHAPIYKNDDKQAILGYELSFALRVGNVSLNVLYEEDEEGAAAIVVKSAYQPLNLTVDVVFEDKPTPTIQKGDDEQKATVNFHDCSVVVSWKGLPSCTDGNGFIQVEIVETDIDGSQAVLAEAGLSGLGILQLDGERLL